MARRGIESQRPQALNGVHAQQHAGTPAFAAQPFEIHAQPGAVLHAGNALHEFGWHMTDVYDDFDADIWQPAATARRFECGSPNMLGIHALNASLELLQDIGMTMVQDAVLQRSAWLQSALRASPDVEPWLELFRNAGRFVRSA